MIINHRSQNILLMISEKNHNNINNIHTVAAPLSKPMASAPDYLALWS